MERHDLDPISLFFGIAFLGLASTGLFDDVDFTPVDGRWLWPALLIIAGLLVLATSVRRPNQATDTTEDLPSAIGTFNDDDVT